MDLIISCSGSNGLTLISASAFCLLKLLLVGDAGDSIFYFFGLKVDFTFILSFLFVPFGVFDLLDLKESFL